MSLTLCLRSLSSLFSFETFCQNSDALVSIIVDRTQSSHFRQLTQKYRQKNNNERVFRRKTHKSSLNDIKALLKTFDVSLTMSSRQRSIVERILKDVATWMRTQRRINMKLKRILQQQTNRIQQLKTHVQSLSKYAYQKSNHWTLIDRFVVESFAEWNCSSVSRSVFLSNFNEHVKFKLKWRTSSRQFSFWLTDHLSTTEKQKEKEFERYCRQLSCWCNSTI